MSENVECVKCSHWMRHHDDNGCGVVTGNITMDLGDWHCPCKETVIRVNRES